SANVYSMDFRNEIAPIGKLSDIGTPLRKNVGASYRRGIEADASWRATKALLLSGNLTLSTNRIREYVDSTGDTPVRYTNVSPLLTPRVLTYARAAYDVTRQFGVALETRYQGESFLQNTGDKRFVLPAYTDVSASASWRIRSYELVARVNN